VGFGQSSGKQKFSSSKVCAVASIVFRQSQVSEIGSKIFGQVLGKFKSGFFVRLTFSGKAFGSQSHFFSKRFGKFGSGVFALPQFQF
jgi:hypothetical protein